MRGSNFIRSSMGRRKRHDAAETHCVVFRPVIHLHHLMSEHGLLFNFIVLIPLLFMPMFTPVLCLHVQSVCYRTAASLISFTSGAIQSPGHFSYFPSKREILPLLIGFRPSERTRLPNQTFWKSGRRDWKSSCAFRCKV